MAENKVSIFDIFSSVNGEGMAAGSPTVFVRLTECNRCCLWCDTPDAQTSNLAKHVLSSSELVEVVSAMPGVSCQSVTFTGGEPLVHADYVEAFVAEWGRRTPVMLETNGDLLQDRMFPWFDHVAVSPKLASSGQCFLRWSELQQWGRFPYVCVKFVIAGERDYAEMAEVVDKYRLSRQFKDRLVLQPCDPKSHFVALWRMFQKHPIAGVRLLPQMHKLVSLP